MSGIRFGLLAVWVVLVLGCESDVKGGPSSFVLKVFVNGTGVVNSTDGSIKDCTSSAGTCEATLPSGTSVELFVTEKPGSVFHVWAGTCAGSQDFTCHVVMTRDREEVAIFNPVAIGGVGDVFGLTSDNRVFSFDRAAPDNIRSNVQVTGMAAGDTLVGIDFRPVNGLLYGLAKQGTGTAGTGRLYLINQHSRSATLVATLSTNLTGSDFAMDFDPTNDSLRVISNSGQSLTVAMNGTAAPGAMSAGVTALAHASNIAGAANTTLYGINSTSDQLVRVLGTNVTPVGFLGANIGPGNGFDIDPLGEIAYIAYTTTSPQFATVNLTTGAITGSQPLAVALNIGETLSGLAVPTPGAPQIFGINRRQQTGVSTQSGTVERQMLVRFSALSPEDVFTLGDITGLDAAAGDMVVGIDFRPATGVLYGLARGSNGSGQLYTMSTSGAAATAVGPRSAPGTLGDAVFGMDFDPARDVIRVVSTAGQNLRLDPATGAVTSDTTLSRAPMQPTAIAFDNSYAGASSSTLYAIDTAQRRFGIINTAASDGRFERPFSLGIAEGLLATLDVNGFEIIGSTDPDNDPRTPEANRLALAAFGSATKSVLFQINLDTGLAEPVGEIGPTSFQKRVVGISALPERRPLNHPNQLLYAITEDLRLVSFSRSNPGGGFSLDCAINGLSAGDAVLGFDIRPMPSETVSGSQLYLLVDGTAANRLVVVSLATCAVDVALTRVLTPAPGDPYVDADLDGKRIGMDFNAASNTFRVTTADRKHFLIDPATAVVTTRPAGIFERSTAVGAAAYSDGTTPTLYALNLDATPVGPIPTLMTQEPDPGVLRDIGVLFPDGRPIDTDTTTSPLRAVASVDILGINNAIALAVLRARSSPTTDELFTRLYRVNVTTGLLTEVLGSSCVGNDCGGIGPRMVGVSSEAETRLNVTDIAIRLPPIP